MMDTAALVECAARGDELAWRQLVARYEPTLWHIGLTYRLHYKETEDAIATTWMKLVEHIGTIRDRSRVASWLVTTLRRECCSRIRTRNREQLVGDFVGTYEPTDSVDFDSWIIKADRCRAFRQALAKLPERHRQLIVMLCADPAPSYQEISTSLSIPIGSIGPIRGRLLRNLREMMTVGETELAKAG